MSLLLGSHVSIAKGLLGAAQEAHSYGSDTFMVYTGAPQNTRRKELQDMKIEEGKAFMREHQLIGPIVHAPYIINLASHKDSIYTLAKDFLRQELIRSEAFGAKYIVLHPGSFTETNLDYGTQQIIDGLNEVLTGDEGPMICLETMAGKGSEIGRTFEELANIIAGVTHDQRLGICLDTCHIHDAGYDIIHDLDGVLDTFDAILGLDRLKVLHINGSLNPRGAHKDRHANLGADATNPKGQDHIGFNTLYNVVHHPRLTGRPMILETPWLDKKTNLYKEEIERLRK